MHGYDHPWAGGANNNKWDEVWELGGITADTGEDTPANDRIRSKNYTAVTPSADYYLSMSNYGAWIYCYDTNKDYISRFNQPAGGSFTVPSNCYYIRFVTYAEYGTTYGDDIAINYPATVTTYSPYSNICPISGRTETSVTTRNEDNTETASATISFGTTVYGGQVDFKTGNVTVEWGYIASYNGESLPGAWISDRDVYAAGTTPTTDAEVCYELATPTTLSLTPDILTMLKNNNSVSGDGVITITALTGDSWS